MMKKILSAALSLMMVTSVFAIEVPTNFLTKDQKAAMGLPTEPEKWYENKWVKVGYQGAGVVLAIATVFAAGQSYANKKFAAQLAQPLQAAKDAHDAYDVQVKNLVRVTSQTIQQYKNIIQTYSGRNAQLRLENYELQLQLQLQAANYYRRGNRHEW
jgi:hypothetical protein